MGIKTNLSARWLKDKCSEMENLAVYIHSRPCKYKELGLGSWFTPLHPCNIDGSRIFSLLQSAHLNFYLWLPCNLCKLAIHILTAICGFQLLILDSL